MEMFFTDEDGTVIQYDLVTDPPEAMYWTTYKLKKSHIKIISKMDRSTAASYREKILASILIGEKRADDNDRNKVGYRKNSNARF